MYQGFDLTDKIAVLTGATSGMGLAIARGLAICGARVVLSSNRDEDVAAAIAALESEGHAVQGVRCDITNSDDVATFGARSEACFGPADILFCLAAPPTQLGSIGDADPAEFERLILAAGPSNLAIARQFLPGMAERGGGSIVAMSSTAALRANPGLGIYGIAKAALSALVRSIAVEWGPRNVRANAIAPSIVRTAFSKEVWADENRAKAVEAGVPLRRIAEPEDIVGLAILLASPAGAYINGQTIRIDGGRSIA